MIPIRILLIRHGDPDYSVDSLTEQGWREAELLSQRLSRLPVSAVYCSPLGRARDTARPTLEKLRMEAEIHDFLQEFLYPVTDPLTGKQLQFCWDFPPSRWTEEPENYEKDGWLQTPLMRSGDIAGKFKMVGDGLDGILARHGYVRKNNRYTTRQGNTDTILIFCHAGIVSVLVGYLLGIPAPILWNGCSVGTSSVTTFISEEQEKGEVFFRCHAFGDLSHLFQDVPPGKDPYTVRPYREVFPEPETPRIQP